jgi:hypothetical protein
VAKKDPIRADQPAVLRTGNGLTGCRMRLTAAESW